MARFLAWVKTDAPLILYGVQAILAAAVAFGLRATPAETGAVLTVTAGLITVLTALAVRPVRVPAITGAVATVATAAAAFGLHLSSDQISTGVSALALVLALVLRQNVTPAALAESSAPGRI